MDMTNVTAIVGVLVALSVATERAVEMVKGVIPGLTGKSDSQKKEGLRRTANQLLAVGAGILTTFLARPAIPQDILPLAGDSSVIALGLLASGGSGFWNGVLSYVLQVKDLKEVAATAARKQAGLATPK